MLCYIFFNYSYISVRGSGSYDASLIFRHVVERHQSTIGGSVRWKSSLKQALLLLGLSELKKKKKKKEKALLLGHGDARPNSPFVQEERLDEVVDMLGPLQLQRVPCVLDDLQPGIASQMPAFSNDSWQNVQR
jgi:hypothetical protein